MREGKNCSSNNLSKSKYKGCGLNSVINTAFNIQTEVEIKAIIAVPF